MVRGCGVRGINFKNPPADRAKPELSSIHYYFQYPILLLRAPTGMTSGCIGETSRQVHMDNPVFWLFYYRRVEKFGLMPGQKTYIYQ
jgi:hypothetical protein